MSIADKITRLQAAKNGIASAISAKGGTVGSTDGFEEFASDIASIPSGGGFNPLLHVTTGASLFYGAKLPNTTHLVFGEKAKDFSACFRAAECDDLTLEFLGQPTNFSDMFRKNDSSDVIKNITIIGDTSKVTQWQRFIYNNQRPEKMFGELDLSSATNVDSAFILNDALTCIQFKANTIPLSITFDKGILDDESLVSIANGLNESKTGKTVTFSNNDYKTRLPTILGTVAMDSTNTYHVFTKNSAGTVNLQDFITNTKGWAIA